VTRTGLSRRLFPLGLAFLAAGLSLALVGPFLALFLATDVHAGPVKVTAFLVLSPLAGVAVSWAIGRASDRRPMRRRLLIIAALAGLLASALFAVIRDYWTLLVLASTLTAVAGALFPQTFAYAREVLQRDDPRRAALGISALRTVFSLAYVCGPPVAALLLGHGGFRAVYGAAALMYAVAALVAFRWLSEVEAPAAHPDDEPPPVPAPDAPRAIILLTVAAFTLLQTPLVLGVQALALFVEHDLHGTVGNAGLILGFCAALEIPLMLGFGLLTNKISVRTLILAGAACGVVYEGIAFGAPTVWVLVLAQVANALYIASTSSLGISYVQDMMPAHPGRATTMFTNTFPIGQILAGPLFGLAQHLGYRWAFAMNLVCCLLGLLLLVATRPATRGTPLRLRRARAGGADAASGDRRPA
jgi:SET family sugar efflux transporter-like MFS transporter